MNKNKEREELQSRREFFKKAAKGALPILGFVLFANFPLTMDATNKVATGCDSCTGTCSYTCQGTCRGKCMGCSNTCQGTCQGGCTGGCSYTCQGTCKDRCQGGCKGSSR